MSAEKILRHSEALGGVARFTFQMNASSLPHAKLMTAIEVLGTKVAPQVRRETGQTAANAPVSSFLDHACDFFGMRQHRDVT